MSIYELQPGCSGTVRTIGARGAIRQRLLDLGILPSVSVRVERIAPAGGPVWITVSGSHLALRRQEAEAVELTT